MSPKIIDLDARDIRFPTSKNLDGSDAMNPDPDYSAAYVVLTTDTAGLEGHGLTFTIGRGTEICVAAARAFAGLVRACADVTFVARPAIRSAYTEAAPLAHENEYLYARALERLLIEKEHKVDREVAVMVYGKRARFSRVFFENRFKHRNT